MLLERVVGRWAGSTGSAEELSRLDFVDLAWDDCHRRAMQKVSRGKRPIRILLRVGTTVRHHDVLVDSPELLLVIEIQPTPTLVVRPRTLAEASTIAMEWGNLHLPIEITPDSVVTLPDGPAEEAADRHSIPFVIESRRFQPTAISGISWSTPNTTIVRRGVIDSEPMVRRVREKRD